NGTLTFSSGGYYTYTPNTNFDGVDFFSYRVCDAGPDGNIATTTDNSCDTAIVTLRSLFNCDSTKFYVPLPENEAMDFLEDISSTNGDSTQVYIGLSVSTDAVVVYDHWEDGYESNIKAPTQSSTRIWGDGDLSNGIAPGFPTDLLDAGKAIILSNKLVSGHNGTTTYNPNGATSDNTLQATVDYDGKDKIFVGGNGALTKFAWGSLGTVSVS
ncbi:MAG: Ig-like domain-containing protein, partial [Chitinophagaceae bacterium]